MGENCALFAEIGINTERLSFAFRITAFDYWFHDYSLNWLIVNRQTIAFLIALLIIASADHNNWSVSPSLSSVHVTTVVTDDKAMTSSCVSWRRRGWPVSFVGARERERPRRPLVKICVTRWHRLAATLEKALDLEAGLRALSASIQHRILLATDACFMFAKAAYKEHSHYLCFIPRTA